MLIIIIIIIIIIILTNYDEAIKIVGV